MTNSKSTKRSLLTSSISLLLSFAMLLGTTFAWFTDSVSVGNNVIKSGNLDVELWYWDNGMQTNQSVNLEDESDLKLLRNADGEEILWEPGALGFGQFEVKNEGSLALKYELKLNFEDVVKTPDGKSLSDVLTVYAIARGCNEGSEPGMGDPDLNQFVNNWDSPINGFNGIPLNDFTLDGYLLPGESFTYEIRAYWKPSDKDNDYNVKDGLQIDFGATLLATQMTYEKDSVNEMYDEKATYPEMIEVKGTDKTAVMNAINNANPGDIIRLTENTTIAGYDGTKKLVIEKPVVIDLGGKTLTTECGWGGIDLKGGASIINGTINHTGNTAAIKAFQVDKIENVTINVTETAGKTKGGIVVQQGDGCYVGSIKNVTINGATNGIECYRSTNEMAIGSMENVTINATINGIYLNGAGNIGSISNCNIKGGNIGINAYLANLWNISLNIRNSKISGSVSGIDIWDEAKTNTGSTVTFNYDDATEFTGDTNNIKVTLDEEITCTINGESQQTPCKIYK